ncbi:MAG: GDP-mannose 4,6-dehydratase [Terriglobia bacterium]
MRTLVTGGAGFAGSHLCEYLLELGHEVIVVAAEQESLVNIAHLRDRVRVERADLRDSRRLTEIVHNTAPRFVYHLAALSSPADSLQSPALTYEVNFVGTLNLLLACRQEAPACRFLFVSSSEVYGAVSDRNLPIREDTPLHPANPYAASKAAGEILAEQFFRSYGLQIIRARPFNHTGPRQSGGFVCSDFARQVAEIDLEMRPPTISVGNLQVKRDFSDVRDIVRGYYLLLEKGEPGDVYHLGSGQATAIEEILHILMGMTSKPVQPVVDPSRTRGGEARSLWGDTVKAEQKVGWGRRYDLKTTLQDLFTYWTQRLRTATALISPPPTSDGIRELR